VVNNNIMFIITFANVCHSSNKPRFRYTRRIEFDYIIAMWILRHVGCHSFHRKHYNDTPISTLSARKPLYR